MSQPFKEKVNSIEPFERKLDPDLLKWGRVEDRRKNQFVTDINTYISFSVVPRKKDEFVLSYLSLGRTRCQSACPAYERVHLPLLLMKMTLFGIKLRTHCERIITPISVVNQFIKSSIRSNYYHLAHSTARICQQHPASSFHVMPISNVKIK